MLKKLFGVGHNSEVQGRDNPLNHSEVCPTARYFNNVFQFPREADRMRYFSVRELLEKQGVKTEEGMRVHMNFISKTLMANPNLDLTRYRVNPKNPEGLPLQA